MLEVLLSKRAFQIPGLVIYAEYLNLCADVRKSVTHAENQSQAVDVNQSVLLSPHALA